MRTAYTTAFALGIGVIGLAACGGGGNTTVIKTSPASEPPTVTQTKTTSEPAPKKTTPAPPAAPDSQNPPNVVGIALPDAKKLLSEAGFSASVKNTDTAFGIIVPSNYTVCKEGEPRGTLVQILAQKYGCK